MFNNNNYELEEEEGKDITEVFNIIAIHIMLCAEELKMAGYDIEDFKY